MGRRHFLRLAAGEDFGGGEIVEGGFGLAEGVGDENSPLGLEALTRSGR